MTSSYDINAFDRIEIQSQDCIKQTVTRILKLNQGEIFTAHWKISVFSARTCDLIVGSLKFESEPPTLPRS